jgi:GNAT superfamily N-acetyltransferase
VSVRIARDLDGVDWTAVRADLLADDFDNGRSPVALERSFAASQHVAMAWDAGHVVGTARLLSDGVCNAYLVDVWTISSHRRQGVASAMVRDLMAQVPGQHIALQTDDAQAFYETLGFHPQPELYSVIVGTWLDNAANADT